jgi:hypothetical protein
LAIIAVGAPNPWEAIMRIAADMIALRLSSLLGLAMFLLPNLDEYYIREWLVSQYPISWGDVFFCGFRFCWKLLRLPLDLRLERVVFLT